MKSVSLLVSLFFFHAYGFEATTKTQSTPGQRLHSRYTSSSSSIFYHSDISFDDNFKSSSVSHQQSHMDLVVYDEADIDEYLIFLDRRYNRLHGDVKPRSLPNRMQTGIENSATNEKNSNEQEDRYQTLRFGEIASRKLLPKFQIVSQSSNAVGNSIIVPTATLLAAGGAPSMQLLSLVWASVVSLSNIMSLVKRLCLREPGNRIVTVLNFLSQTATSNITRSARTVWRTGGGLKNTTWTLTVMTAFVLLLVKPQNMSMTHETTNLSHFQ